VRRALYALAIASILAAFPIAAQVQERSVTIGASGDVLAHIKVNDSARLIPGGYGRVLAGVRETIDANEIAFVNLETPLSMRIPPVSGDPPILGAPPELAAALGEAGVDIVSVANNHAYDQGSEGMGETLRALDAAHVIAVGANADETQVAGPRVIERNGVRVAFVAFTERINRGPAERHTSTHVARFDRALAAEVLSRARANADLVVLSIHWSHDFITQPMIAQRRLASFLVESGADVILGHGPHVLQEVARLPSPRGEAVCAFSLGNLVSNQALRWTPGRRHLPANMHPAVITPELRDGAWVRISARIGDRIAIEPVRAMPLWTFNDHATHARGAPDDIHIETMAQADPRVRAERLPVIARALGSQVTLIEGP
jgi:hypothetical protein